MGNSEMMKPAWQLWQTGGVLIVLAITIPRQVLSEEYLKYPNGKLFSNGLDPIVRTDTNTKDAFARSMNSLEAADKSNMMLRHRRSTDDEVEDDKQTEEETNFPAFLRAVRSDFHQPRMDRSNWQVPYPRMGKRIPESVIPMARLGRSNMIPMARLGRSLEQRVIPMARLGRSSFKDGNSIIPMARLGRSGQDTTGREEMMPVYLPSEEFLPEVKPDESQYHNSDYENLLNSLDDFMKVLIYGDKMTNKVSAPIEKLYQRNTRSGHETIIPMARMG